VSFAQRAGSLLAPTLLVLLACGLLYRNTERLGYMRDGRFYWLDAMAAVKLHLDQRWPPETKAPEPVGDLAWHELTPKLEHFTRIMTRMSARLPPDRAFWRTIPTRPFVRNRASWVSTPSYLDPGRAMLLAWGYRHLGGIAPNLILWLGALAMIPVLAWAVIELWMAGFHGGSIGLGTLVPSSLYVIQCLALGHSAFGFYLVALICLVAISPYASRNSTTVAGLLGRALVAGGVLAICVLCRSGSILLGGGFLLALVLAASRLQGPVDAKRRAGIVLLACAMLFLPPFLVQRPQQHPVWAGFWEGLGDFDRTKGYYWDDAKAREALAATGLQSEWVDLASPQAEVFFRDKVVSDVLDDPVWYAGILARRIAAVLLQPKLWPRPGVDGRTYALSIRPNEGRIDGYYKFTPTTEVFAVGGGQWEAPITLLVAPSLLLLGAALASRWAPSHRHRLQRAERAALVLVCPLAGAITLPVLLTTAAAQEMQAIGLVYFLGLGLFLDALPRPRRLAPR
jgi:hypothetical protein